MKKSYIAFPFGIPKVDGKQQIKVKSILEKSKLEIGKRVWKDNKSLTK